MSNLLDRLRPERRELIDAVAVALLTAIGLLAFRSSYGGTTFFVLGLVFATVGITVAYLSERFELPLLVSAVAAVVVFAVVGGTAALPSRAIGGFLPSPDTVLVGLKTTVTGWKELITTSPPVGRTGDLMIIPVFAGFTAGFVAYLVARRLEVVLLAIVGPFLVLALAIATGTKEPVSIAAQGIGFTVVTIAWVSWREYTRRPLLEGAGIHQRQLAMAAAVLAVASVGGYAVAGKLPLADHSDRDIWRQTVTPPFDPREYPSPLSGYRQYVNAANNPDGDDPVLFTVEGLPSDIPVRLATLDTYDGLVWQVSAGNPDEPSLRDSGSFERVGASLQPEYPGEIAEVIVTIDEYGGVWIPDVGEVIELRFTGGVGGTVRDRRLAEQFRYNRSTDTAASRLPLEKGDRYVMKVRLPVVVPELVEEQIVPDIPRLGPSRQVGALTQKLIGPDMLAINGTGERLDKVRDLMAVFGTYSDGDTEGGQIRAASGHSDQRLTSFVSDYPRTPLIGNAEQYASAYALLFRGLGQVPTRVVMGFVPSAASLSRPVEVHASEVEAWVEVPLVDKGWVAIFPTPPRDQTALTSSSPQQPEPDYRTQNPPPPPLIDPEFDQPATAAGDAKAPDEEEIADDEDNSFDEPGKPVVSGRTLRFAVFGLSPFVGLAAVMALVVGLKARRRKRRRSLGVGHERIANGWREITDFSVDAGKDIPPATTRREAATFVGSDTVVLAKRADAAVWGAGEPDDATVDTYWEDLVQQLKAMRSEMGVVDRLKAAISIQSLKNSRRRNKNGHRRG